MGKIFKISEENLDCILNENDFMSYDSSGNPRIDVFAIKNEIKQKSEIQIQSKIYLVEGLECTLEEIQKENEFTDDDELFQMIAQLEVGHTIGEGLNMATITRIK